MFGCLKVVRAMPLLREMEARMVELHARLEGAVNVYTMDTAALDAVRCWNVCSCSNSRRLVSMLGIVMDPSEVPAWGSRVVFRDKSCHGHINFYLQVLGWCELYRLWKELREVLVERLMHLNSPSVTGYVR
ncbi:hypothetical protein GQ600_6673 [Phytophthora cactorum]|nr:hypothetical protein GQ600_6673 [Phytophthora cactorum]